MSCIGAVRQSRRRQNRRRPRRQHVPPEARIQCAPVVRRHQQPFARTGTDRNRIECLHDDRPEAASAVVLCRFNLIEDGATAVHHQAPRCCLFVAGVDHTNDVSVVLHVDSQTIFRGQRDLADHGGRACHQMAWRLDAPARGEGAAQCIGCDGRFEEDVGILDAVGTGLQCLSHIEEHVASQLVRFADFDDEATVLVNRKWQAAREAPSRQPAFDERKVDQFGTGASHEEGGRPPEHRTALADDGTGARLRRRYSPPAAHSTQ